MTLRKYLEALNNLVKNQPELLDVDIVYSGDDEGNYYNDVYFNPTPMYRDSNDEVMGLDDAPDYKANVVCIN